jgi:hypothetical protein
MGVIPVNEGGNSRAGFLQKRDLDTHANFARLITARKLELLDRALGIA